MFQCVVEPVHIPALNEISYLGRKEVFSDFVKKKKSPSLHNSDFNMKKLQVLPLRVWRCSWIDESLKKREAALYIHNGGVRVINW